MKKNQGFSLVELIVVIAIMAVLVGVLAPAYLRYVEKSRKSADVSAVSDIMSAAEKVAVDVQFDLPAGTQFKITITTGVTALAVSAGTDMYADATTEWQSIAGNGGVYTCKSKEFKKADANVTLTGTIADDGGSVEWEASAQSAIVTYSNDFKTKWGL